MYSITSKFLTSNFGIAHTEILQNLLKSYTENLSEWRLAEIPNINEPLDISLEQLPKALKLKVAKLQKFQGAQFTDHIYPDKSDKFMKLCLLLKSTYDNNFQEHIPELKNYARSKDELEYIITKNSIFSYCLYLNNEQEFYLHEIYHALHSIGLKYYINISSFRRKLALYKKEGVIIFLNKNRDKPKHWLRKSRDLHHFKIAQLYRKGKDSNQITTLLNAYCENNDLPYLSRSSVKNIIKSNYFKAKNDIERRGEDYIKNNIMGYIEKEKPQYKLQVLEADGSRLHLPYQCQDNSKWKAKYLTLYVILDVSCNKVIGYSIDDFENKEMVLFAFFMMLVNYKHLPAVIRIDRSSSHTSDRFKDFKKYAEEIAGTKFRICREAREKGTVENFYHWFPLKICKRYPIYTGLGPLVKDKDKKENPDRIYKIERSYKKLPTKNQIITFIPTLINEYNNYSSDKKRLNPTQKFEQLKIKNAVFIKEEQIALLTWDLIKKTKLSKNTIRIQRGSEKYSYNFKDYEVILKSHDISYNVCFLLSEPNCIYVFDEKMNFIDKAFRKNRYLDDPINITEESSRELIKEKNLNYGLLKYLKQLVKNENHQLALRSKKLFPFNISSGMNSDKNAAHQIEEDYLTRYHRLSLGGKGGEFVTKDEPLENKTENDIIKKSNTKQKKIIPKKFIQYKTCQEQKKKFKEIKDVEI